MDMSLREEEGIPDPPAAKLFIDFSSGSIYNPVNSTIRYNKNKGNGISAATRHIRDEIAYDGYI